MISGNGEGHQINCRKNNIYYSVNLELNAASFRPQYLLRKLHPFFGQWAETSIPKFCSLAVSLWRQIVSDEVSRMDKISRMGRMKFVYREFCKICAAICEQEIRRIVEKYHSNRFSYESSTLTDR